MPTPPVGATKSTLQIGTYNPNTDSFTLVFDLNDGTVCQIMNSTLKIGSPEQALDYAENPRTDGQRPTRAHYKNRKVSCTFSIRGASTSAIFATLRSFVAAVWPGPFVLRYAPPGATQYSYFDVILRGCTHDGDFDPQKILAGAMKVNVIFECAPFVRGDRLYLSNLVMNPGFEGPTGGGGISFGALTTFNDNFANANAYATVAGTNNGVASNVMFPQGGCTLTFGSPAWGAIALWQIRFQYLSGGTYYFCLHYTDASNQLRVDINSTTQFLTHNVAGTAHTFASAAVTMTNAAWYWLQITQFPSNAGGKPYVQAVLRGDSSGAPGTTLATLGPAQTFDSVTALTGHMGIIANGAQLPIGGAFANVNQVQLFGPGAWNWVGTNSSTGLVSGAWDGTRGELGMSGNAPPGTNTYGGGPVTSFGAARLDLAPAGTANALWRSYVGGAPAGSPAIPCGVGNTVGASAYARSSGLGANAQINLDINQWDASGNFLRTSVLQTLGGNQASWTQLAGSVTTGASCAYVSIVVQVVDSTTGSAGGTVWFDNLQAWNQTTTGQTSMPYCELRMPNSPAQLMVSGLVGDVPAPAYLGFGTYLGASFAAGTVLRFVIGRAAVVQGTAVSSSPQLVGMTTSTTPGAPALDVASYGGFYQVSVATNLTMQTWQGISNYQQPRAVAFLGTYHLFTRAQSTQATGNIGNVTVDAAVFDGLYQAESTQVAALSAGSTWTDVDAGQLVVPVTPYGALTGYAVGTFVTPQAVWRDATAGGSGLWSNWFALVPTDGNLLAGTLINPTNSTNTPSASWQWIFSDPLAVNSGMLGTEAGAWRVFVSGSAYQSGQAGGGGPGVLSGSYPNVNPTADPYLLLDPSPANAGGSAGVNLLVGRITDAGANIYALVAELAYSPLYLHPR